MNNIYDPFYEVTSNTRELTESEKELQQLAKFMYENFPEYETASEESFSYKAIRILESLKSQLADIKYLSRDEVEKLIEDNTKIYRDVENKEFDYFHRDKFLDAICKLAIPDIDNEVGEPVTGKPDLCPIETKDIYYSDVKLCGTGGGAGIGYKHKVDREKIIEVLKDIQKTYGKCFDLIEEEELSTIADEIITALEGK